MISGKNIILKLVTENDLSLLYQNICHLEYRGHLYPLTLTSHSEFKKNFLETGFWNEAFGRLIILNLEGEMVGTIHCFKTVPYSNALEIGYLIFGSQHTGKGYATEALSLFTNYLFSTRQMNRIQLRIAPEHKASISVALKCGYQFDGVRKQMIYLHGHHRDLNEYALLRDEWEQLSLKSDKSITM